jgi:hypothetical protein
MVAEYDDTVSYGCNITKRFWISWMDGLLTLGSGSVVGQKAMLNYKDQAPFAVNYLAVASGVSSSMSNWTIPAELYTNGCRLD